MKTALYNLIVVSFILLVLSACGKPQATAYVVYEGQAYDCNFDKGDFYISFTSCVELPVPQQVAPLLQPPVQQ